MIELLFFLGVVLTGLYLYMTWHHGHWKKHGVASDKPSVLFGSVADALLMRANQAELFDRLYTSFPGEKLVGWYKIRQPALLVRDPALVSKVFVTDFHSFRHNDIDVRPSEDPMSRNAFVLKDEEWKRTRSLITPAFSSGKIKAMYPQMTEVAKEFTEYLKKHPEELHVKDTMARFITETAARCAFGIEGNSFKEENPAMYGVGKSIFAPSKGLTFNFMIMTFMPFLNSILNLKIVPSIVTEFFDSILKDIIIYRQKNNIERNDLVNWLIELKRKSLEVEKGNVKSDLITRPYTDEDILAGCVMFFVEAFETSSLLLTHIMYQLAMNKDIQDKLREEIQEEMKKGDITYERIHEMVLVNGVLHETNRMMPVVHSHFKRCTEDYEFDLGNGKKVPVKKGTSVVICSYGIHTDPLYWEDPLAFKPERFENNEDVQKARAKGIYMPFGDGPRMCIGVRLSSTIIKVGLVYILSKFEVVTSSKTPKKIEIDPSYVLTTHKGGIHLQFIERN